MSLGRSSVAQNTAKARKYAAKEAVEHALNESISECLSGQLVLPIDSHSTKFQRKKWGKYISSPMKRFTPAERFYMAELHKYSVV